MKFTQTRTRRKQQGAAILLFAIAILIMFVTIGEGLRAMATATDFQNSMTTSARTDRVREAIAKFIAANNRLPCPAIPIADTAVGAGTEAPTPGTCTGALSGTSTKRGILPWVTLGLPVEVSYDAYGRHFTYMVATAATGLTQQTVGGITGTITLHSAAPISLGLAGVGSQNQINACSTTPSETSCNRRGIVALVSHGENGLGGYLPTGTQLTFVASRQNTSDPEYENADSDDALVSKDAISSIDDTVSMFDDKVVVWSAADIIKRVPITESVASADRVTNQKLNLVKMAIIGFAMKSTTVQPGSTCLSTGTPAGVFCRRLPVPDFASPQNGSEDSTTTGTGLYPTSGNHARVPYVSIGLMLDDIKDGWGNYFDYAVSDLLIARAGNTSSTQYRGFSGTAPANPATAVISVCSTKHCFTLTSSGPDGVMGNSDDIYVAVTLDEIRSMFTAAGVTYPP